MLQLSIALAITSGHIAHPLVLVAVIMLSAVPVACQRPFASRGTSPSSSLAITIDENLARNDGSCLSIL